MMAQPVELADYNVIANVEIGILAELDRRIISFGELLRLEVNSTVALSRPVGENIDVYVDHILLGNGEVLVIDESLAVRMADLRDKVVVPKTAGLIEADEAA